MTSESDNDDRSKANSKMASLFNGSDSDSDSNVVMKRSLKKKLNKVMDSDDEDLAMTGEGTKGVKEKENSTKDDDDDFVGGDNEGVPVKKNKATIVEDEDKDNVPTPKSKKVLKRGKVTDDENDKSTDNDYKGGSNKGSGNRSRSGSESDDAESLRSGFNKSNNEKNNGRGKGKKRKGISSRSTRSNYSDILDDAIDEADLSMDEDEDGNPIPKNSNADGQNDYNDGDYELDSDGGYNDDNPASDDEYDPENVSIVPKKRTAEKGASGAGKGKSRIKNKTATNKRSKKTGSGDDGLIKSDDDEGNKQGKPLTAYDKAVAVGKSQVKNTSRKKKKDMEDSTELDDAIQNVIARMVAAAEEDRALNKTKQIACKKLQMLDEVKSWLLKRDILYLLAENKILDAMVAWLTPLPDKSLPSHQIRDCLLDMLQDWQIDLDYLRDSNLGKLVRFLSQHPKETQENKKKANKLIKIWMRPVYKIKSNYSEISRDEQLEMRNRERQMLSTHRNKKNADDDSTSSISSKSGRDALTLSSVISADESMDPTKAGYIKRARIPRKISTDFYISPKGIDESQIRKRAVDPRSIKFSNIKKKIKQKK